MKIENIIEDIINDLQDLKKELEQKFIVKYPSVDFYIELPGLEDFSVIKTVALIIKENEIVYHLSVQIHTHNGNRLFENPSKKIIDDQLVLSSHPHPYQEGFVILVRDIIKRKKRKMQSGKWGL